MHLEFTLNDCACIGGFELAAEKLPVVYNQPLVDPAENRRIVY